MEKKNGTSAEAIAWILQLPEEGGAWGLGITEMVKSVESEVGVLEAQRSSIDEQIKARKKLLKQTVKRAEKEAPLLYSGNLIDFARKQHVAQPLVPDLTGHVRTV